MLYSVPITWSVTYDGAGKLCPLCKGEVNFANPNGTRLESSAPASKSLSTSTLICLDAFG